MKKFKSLREAVTDHIVPKKDDEKNMSKNDVKFADLHTVETDDHPVATDAQHPKKGKKKFSGVRKVKANEEVDLEEATGKEIAAKMMKDMSMKAFASKVAKMKTVTRDNLEKMLPDYVAGAAITKLFEEATGKEIAAKMMKDMSMKAFASKVAKMKTVTRDNLEKMLPDYVAGAAITKLFEEEIFLDEAVKAGMMKLKDGKSVKVSKEDAATLNSVLEDLNPDNRKRMEEELRKDVKSYKNMLTFAKRTG